MPKDCEVLFIQAPQNDLSKDDLEKIESYVKDGGVIYVGIDYKNYNEQTNLKKLLSDNGITTTESVVGEGDKSYYYQNQFYLLPQVENTDLSSSVAGNSSVFAPYCVGLKTEDENAISFLSTSDKSFGKAYANLTKDRTDETQVTLFEKEEGDEAGPFSLGLMVENEKGGKVIALGSSYIFTDKANEMVSGKNAKLFTDILNNTVENSKEEANTIVIPSKDYSVSNLTISQRAVLIYGLLWGIFMPLISIVVGIVIWAKRRKK